jgi:hypothetical protein
MDTGGGPVGVPAGRNRPVWQYVAGAAGIVALCTAVAVCARGCKEEPRQEGKIKAVPTAQCEYAPAKKEVRHLDQTILDALYPKVPEPDSEYEIEDAISAIADEYGCKKDKVPERLIRSYFEFAKVYQELEAKEAGTILPDSGQYTRKHCQLIKATLRGRQYRRNHPQMKPAIGDEKTLYDLYMNRVKEQEAAESKKTVGQ